jgi:diacylglycerol kinase (ATP)
MSENKKVFFIVNKFSGTGYKDSIEGRILSTCLQAGLEPTIEFTKQRGHATELAQAAVAEGFNRVFAVGGDGTVNETARGLLHTDAALGILPNGSGNGLARHLGISTSFKTALSLIHSTSMIKMDSTLVNGHLSVNVAGIGFDGHVAALFGKNGKRGLPGYARLVLKEFSGFQEFGGQANIDGEAVDLKGFIMAVCNSSQFGNNARIAPHASVCDAELDLCLVRKTSFLKAVNLIRKVFAGNLDTSPLVTIRKMKNLQLSLSSPVHFHTDGEPHPKASEYTIKVLPGSLNVIVPQSRVGF